MFRHSSFATLLVAIVAAYLWPVVLFRLARVVPSREPFGYLLTIVGALGLGMLALWAMRRDGMSLESVGWSRKGLVQAVIFIVLSWVWAAGVLLFFGEVSSFGDLFVFPLPRVIVQWFFVGLAEELLFRGYILGRLLRCFERLGRVGASLAAACVSSFIFATFHIPQRMAMQGMELRVEVLLERMVPLFLIGLFWTWLFLRSRNVPFVGLAHGGMNAPLVGQRENLVPIVLSFLVWAEVMAWKRRRAAPASG